MIASMRLKQRSRTSEIRNRYSKQFVDFEKESSVVFERIKYGKFVHYGVIENVHVNHILDISFAPAAYSNV